MADRRFVLPANETLAIPDPYRRDTFGQEGRWVEWDQYWERMLQAGDIVIDTHRDADGVET